MSSFHRVTKYNLTDEVSRWFVVKLQLLSLFKPCQHDRYNTSIHAAENIQILGWWTNTGVWCARCHTLTMISHKLCIERFVFLHVAGRTDGFTCPPPPRSPKANLWHRQDRRYSDLLLNDGLPTAASYTSTPSSNRIHDSET